MRKYLKEGQYSFDESEVLGKGSFGKVYRAYDHVDSKWVAIKSIDLDTLEKYGEEMKTIICKFYARQATR
jgi:serine/threonine protein kinase